MFIPAAIHRSEAARSASPAECGPSQDIIKIGQGISDFVQARSRSGAAHSPGRDYQSSPRPGQSSASDCQTSARLGIAASHRHRFYNYTKYLRKFTTEKRLALRGPLDMSPTIIPPPIIWYLRVQVRYVKNAFQFWNRLNFGCVWWQNRFRFQNSSISLK